MNECRSAFCFHLILAAAAVLRMASKNQALLCCHTRSVLRGAIASQRARLSVSGTIRRVAVLIASNLRNDDVETRELLVSDVMPCFA